MEKKGEKREENTVKKRKEYKRQERIHNERIVSGCHC